MNISLTPQLAGYIQEKVDSGLYTSTSEVIREALRLMYVYENTQKKQIAQLNRMIDVGLNQLSRGNRLSAKESYNKLKSKIDCIARAGE